jgi:hypothetical protein
MTVDVDYMVPGAPRLAYAEREDVLALVPPELRSEEHQPVLEALVDILVTMSLEYQRDSDRCIAGCDPDRAEDSALDAVAADRGAERASGEGNEAFRTRTLGITPNASMEALYAAANAILAPWTNKTCQIIESKLDSFCVRSDTTALDWHAFIGAQALYPDRLYDDGTVYTVTGRGGTGAHVYADTALRMFTILLPSLSMLEPADVWPQSTTGYGLFVGYDAFIHPPGANMTMVYRAIENAVMQIAGHSVSFTMIEDRTI